MTKRQLRKAAYKAIVTENKSHQEAFDELSQNSSVDLDELANELSQVPSPAKNHSQQLLRYIFIAALVVIILIRLVVIFGMDFQIKLDPIFLLLVIILGLFAPIYGIVGVITSRIHFYRTTAMLIGLNLFRSLKDLHQGTDPMGLLIFLPFIAAIALGLFIPTKLKTPYTKNRIKEEVDGVTKSRYEYIFENNKLPGSSDLIDADLV